MSQFFASGDQSTGASASASVLVNTQGGFPLGRTSWISLQSKGVLFLFLSFFKFYMDLNTTGSITGKDLAKSSFCFKDFFLRCTNLKVFIDFVTILLLFYVLVFWPRGLWDLSSPTRDRTHTIYIGRQSLNYWTTREVPKCFSKSIIFSNNSFSSQRIRCWELAW